MPRPLTLFSANNNVAQKIDHSPPAGARSPTMIPDPPNIPLPSCYCRTPNPAAQRSDANPCCLPQCANHLRAEKRPSDAASIMIPNQFPVSVACGCIQPCFVLCIAGSIAVARDAVVGSSTSYAIQYRLGVTCN